MKRVHELGIADFPWKVSDYEKSEVLTFNGYPLVKDNERRDELFQEANSRLIASAPELYQYGYGLLMWLKNWFKKYPPTAVMSEGSSYENLVDAMVMLEKTMKKASGEEKS